MAQTCEVVGESLRPLRASSRLCGWFHRGNRSGRSTTSRSAWTPTLRSPLRPCPISIARLLYVANGATRAQSPRRPS